jgi:hypothetical protein
MHERGLASAIFAHDGVNLASAETHVDVIERKNAREPLGHPGDLKDMRTRGHLRPVFANAYFFATLSMLSFV